MSKKNIFSYPKNIFSYPKSMKNTFNDDEKIKRPNYNFDGHKKASPKNNKLLNIPKKQSMPRKVINNLLITQILDNCLTFGLSFV